MLRAPAIVSRFSDLRLNRSRAAKVLRGWRHAQAALASQPLLDDQISPERLVGAYLLD